MNAGSLVLIVNLVSHPTASATAKLIATQCGVQRIVGTDAMLPNLRHTRMKFMNVQKDLVRKIPSLQVIVTEPGMGLHEKNRMQPLAWLGSIRPTHVLVFDPLESPVLVESLDGLKSFQSYALQQLRHVWHDLSSAVQRLPVRVLHVSSPLLSAITQPMGLASMLSWDNTIPFSFAMLTLPRLLGPGISPELYPETTQPIFVESGIRAVLAGWQRPEQIFYVKDSPQPLTNEELTQTRVWEEYLTRPFSLSASNSSQTMMIASTHKRLEDMGNELPVLPCACALAAMPALLFLCPGLWCL